MRKPALQRHSSSRGIFFTGCFCFRLVVVAGWKPVCMFVGKCDILLRVQNHFEFVGVWSVHGISIATYSQINFIGRYIHSPAILSEEFYASLAIPTGWYLDEV